MQYGYSLLLREFLMAEEVEFGDCERFQISCPVCREAVFKKKRARDDGYVTHFLSHYRSEEGDEKDCELRVRGMSFEHLKPYNVQGREQTLKSFLGVLKRAILESQGHTMSAEELASAINRLLSRPVFDSFESYARESVRTLMMLGGTTHPETGVLLNTREVVASMLAGYSDFQNESPFWRRRQASYVLDVLEHLMNKQARENFRYLAAAAYVNISRNILGYRKRLSEDTPVEGAERLVAVELINAMVRGKSRKAMDKMVQRHAMKGASTHQDAERRVNEIYKGIVAELIGPICGILGGTPFPQMAKGEHATRSENRKELEAIFEFIMKKVLGPERQLH